MNRFKYISNIAIIVMMLVGISSCSSSYPATNEIQYSNPSWAPPYYTGVRYYYLPDIQSYYDLSYQDFVYMDNGQWVFSSSLPPMYSYYNLNTGFCVALNSNVYEPWLHHQNYTYHYPRYYYRSEYQDNKYYGARGFNENINKPVFTRDGSQRQNISPKPNENFNQNNADRKQTTTRPPQNPNYSGKNIGQPVKVTPNMRQPKLYQSRGGTNNSNSRGNTQRKKD